MPKKEKWTRGRRKGVLHMENIKCTHAIDVTLEVSYAVVVVSCGGRVVEAVRYCSYSL